MNCPKCGGTVAYAGMSTVECCTTSCDNFGGTIVSQTPPKMRRTWKEYFEELLKKKPTPVPPTQGSVYPSIKVYRRLADQFDGLHEEDDYYDDLP